MGCPRLALLRLGFLRSLALTPRLVATVCVGSQKLGFLPTLIADARDIFGNAATVPPTFSLLHLLCSSIRHGDVGEWPEKNSGAAEAKGVPTCLAPEPTRREKNPPAFLVLPLVLPG
jgi:hypothetical protein